LVLIETSYKIRNRLTGEYSRGGSWPSFTKKGKIWSTKGGLTNHVGQHLMESRYTGYIDIHGGRVDEINENNHYKYLRDCDIITFQSIDPTAVLTGPIPNLLPIAPIPLAVYVKGMVDKKLKEGFKRFDRELNGWVRVNPRLGETLKKLLETVE
jgi:hypothetical protein